MKSALAGAGLVAALAMPGGGTKTDKKPQPKQQSSSVERVSTRTTQNKQNKQNKTSTNLTPMDKWRKNFPELANKEVKPPKGTLSPINKTWEKAHPELAKKERARRAQRGSN